jgi:hypothetical protein
MDKLKRQGLLVHVATLKQAITAAAEAHLSTFLHFSDKTRYDTARRALVEVQELEGLLPEFIRECHSLQDAWAVLHEKYPEILATAFRINMVRKSFMPILDALEHDRLPGVPDSQQLFSAGTKHDAFVAIRELFEGAKQSLLIADNFMDKTLFPLLTNLPEGSTIRLLTKKMSSDFALEAGHFTKQYNVTLEIRLTDLVHDRFIVVDNQRCWHLGASVKDLGGRVALISELGNGAIKSAAIKELEGLWETASLAS